MRVVWWKGGVRRLAHAVGRLVDVLSSRRLRPVEQAAVASRLRSPAERTIFWDQPVPDQRHALAAIRTVSETRPGRHDLIRAALFHDVGKRHGRLGALGRAWAALAPVTRRRPSGRVLDYLEHGRLGARELEALGAEPLVVAFARHHHGKRPDSISAEDWRVLLKADRARLPGSAGGLRRGWRLRPSRAASD